MNFVIPLEQCVVAGSGVGRGDSIYSQRARQTDMAFKEMLCQQRQLSTGLHASERAISCYCASNHASFTLLALQPESHQYLCLSFQFVIIPLTL